MPQPAEIVAQTFYLAQLQACKGSCKCNVCQLLRKSADAMMEEVLNPSRNPKTRVPNPLDVVKDATYKVPGEDTEEEE